MTVTADFCDGLLKNVPALRAFAGSLSGNADRADDLVQETLLRALRHSGQFVPNTNLKAWLFAILRHEFYSESRKRKREVSDPDATIAGRIAVRPEQLTRLGWEDFKLAFAQLPESQREALLLVGAEGFSYEQSADICHISIGTIRSRVHRGRAKLAELLGTAEIDEGVRSESILGYAA